MSNTGLMNEDATRVPRRSEEESQSVHCEIGHKQLRCVLPDVGMFTNSEDSGKVSSAREGAPASSNTPDDVPESPSIDISTSSNVSELPQSTKSADVSRNVNSRETSPSTGKFKSTATPDGLPEEDGEMRSSTEKDLELSSTNDNSASSSEERLSYGTARGTALSGSTFRGRRQSRGSTESKQFAVPSDVWSFTNNAFEPEITQKEDGVQVGLIMKLKTEILFKCINRDTII